MQSWALPNLQQVVDRAVRLKDDLEKTINDQNIARTGDEEEEVVDVPKHHPPIETQEHDTNDIHAPDGSIPPLEQRDNNNNAPSSPSQSPPPPPPPPAPLPDITDTTTTTSTSTTTTNNTSTTPDISVLLHEREHQIEVLSRRLAEQEKEMQQLRERTDGNTASRRVALAEQKAEALMKEGLLLSEKEGKAQQQLRKVRKEKEAVEAVALEREQALKQAEAANVALQAENRELKEVSRRGEESILHITTSGAESSRKLENALSQAQAAEKRESELRYALERSMTEAAESKKQIANLTHELAASKRREENAQFQLREQLDTKQVQGSRAETMERMLGDVKAALEDQLREARKTEADLRLELSRALEAKKQAEARADHLSKSSVDSTAPLLRQIDTLQKLREKNETVLTSLSARAVAAEANEAEAVQARRKSEMARSELSVRVAELEAALASGRAEMSRAVSEAKLANKRAEEAANEREALLEQMDKARNVSEMKLQELRSIEMQLRQNLATEHDKSERMRREYDDKMRDANDKFHVELTKQQQQQQQQIVTEPGGSLVRFDSAGNNGSVMSKDVGGNRASSPAPSSIVEDDFLTQDAILSSALVGFAPSASSGGSVLKFSDLESGIRRRDVRIKALLEQITVETKRRETLALELQELYDKYHVLQASEAHVHKLEGEVNKLTRQNHVLLEMMGESEERYEELRSDLEEVKVKFRAQVDQLLSGVVDERVQKVAS